jgi:hypothetical protein
MGSPTKKGGGGGEDVAKSGSTGGLFAQLLDKYRAQFEDLKVLDVVRFVRDLLRCALSKDGGLFLKIRPKDNLFRLLYEVWPKKSDGYAGMREMKLLVVLSCTRTLLLHLTARVTRKITQQTYMGSSARTYMVTRKLFVLGLGFTFLAAFYNALAQFSHGPLPQIFFGELTRVILELYFGERAYYHITQTQQRKDSVRDPQEIITREVASMSSRLASQINLLITAVPTILWFTLYLFKKSG